MDKQRVPRQQTTPTRGTDRASGAGRRAKPGGGGVMGAEWAGWLLHLRGVEGALIHMASNGIPEQRELIGILAVLGDTVSRVVEEMEQAQDAEVTKAGA